jgi:hypothetical protein
MMRPLSRAEREQLLRLRRQPHEASWLNPSLNRLRRDGLVASTPLIRPSGAMSKYREWSITDAGRQALKEQL